MKNGYYFYFFIPVHIHNPKTMHYNFTKVLPGIFRNNPA